MEKTKTFKSALLVVAFLAFAFLTISVKAQESSTQPGPEDSDASSSAIPGTVNCFDYYQFGSVQVNIEPINPQTVSGVPIAFSGQIVNGNDYPIVDGSVYVKIFRKQNDSKASQANGFILVDQFTAKDKISLAAKGQQDISFNWNIPNYAISGDYQAATYFLTGNKFNLSGLSFTDDVKGNTSSFKVSGQNDSLVEFDKSSVRANSNPYFFSAFIPSFSKDDDITIKANLGNHTNGVQDVTVNWNLYYWDSQNKSNLIDSKKELQHLDAKSTKELAYAINDKQHTVYYLVAEVDYKDTKSILNVRVARTGIESIRINFPAITKFPLKAGEANTLFSCVHGNGDAPIVKNNQLKLSIIDEKGNEIESYEYNGDISGEMMGVKKDFTPKKNIDNFTVKAELAHEGKVVDSAEMKYDCQQIDPKLCSSAAGSSDSYNKAKKAWMSIVVIATMAIILLVIFAYKFKNRLGINIIALLAIFGASLFLANIANAAADSSSCAGGEKLTNSCTKGDITNLKVQSSNVRWVRNPDDFGTLSTTINYGFSMKNQAGSVLGAGSSVPVGSTVYFSPNKLTNDDITWYTMGYYCDSPNGYLEDSADIPPASELGNVIEASAGGSGGEDPPIIIKAALVGPDYNTTGSLGSVKIEKQKTDGTFEEINGSPCSLEVGSPCRIESAANGNYRFTAQPTQVTIYGRDGATEIGSINVNFDKWGGASTSTSNTITLLKNEKIALTAKLALSGDDRAYCQSDANRVRTADNQIKGYNVNTHMSVDKGYGVNITHTGSTAELSCVPAVDGGDACTVNSTGIIKTQVTFNNVYGYFYPHIQKNEICIPGDRVFRKVGGRNVEYKHDFIVGAGANPTYKLPTLTSTLTAVPGNNPPNPPTIVKDTGETTGLFITGLINTPYNFNIVSTDPEGDPLYYAVNWNMDGVSFTNIPVHDPINPANDYVASGTMKQATYQWLTPGVKTFQAKACDNQAASHCSALTTYTLTIPNITEVPCGSADGGSYASLTSGSSNLCYGTDSVVNFSGSGPWTWYCRRGSDISGQCHANSNACTYSWSYLDNCETNCNNTIYASCISSCGGPPVADSNCSGPKPSQSCPACPTSSEGWKEVAPQN